eukprot:scaffold14903_cov107-Isochrysis_galbana.AAC.2
MCRSMYGQGRWIARQGQGTAKLYPGSSSASVVSRKRPPITTRQRTMHTRKGESAGRQIIRDECDSTRPCCCMLPRGYALIHTPPARPRYPAPRLSVQI